MAAMAGTPPFVTVMIVPTGVGASIGGYAGDAMVAMNLMARVSDVLITHPNVANAAVFQKLPDNTLYVEGYGLDQFLTGRWALQPVRQNHIGVLFDRAMPEDMRTVHTNVLHATAMTYGLSLVAVEGRPFLETEEPLALSYGLSSDGISSGALHNPEVLLKGCRRLMEAGATALGLAVHFPAQESIEDATEWAYNQGTGVDPIGGLEAILSHTVVSQCQIPTAHAPVFDWSTACPERSMVVSPQAAAEYIAPTFLPCILTGLQRAPKFILPAELTPQRSSNLTVGEVGAVVAPINALGGPGMMAAFSQGIPLILVSENKTILEVTPEAMIRYFGTPFTLEELIEQRRVVIVRSYLEAAGYLETLRMGCYWPYPF